MTDRVAVIVRMSRAKRRRLKVKAKAAGYSSVNAYVLSLLDIDSIDFDVTSIEIKHKESRVCGYVYNDGSHCANPRPCNKHS